VTNDPPKPPKAPKPPPWPDGLTDAQVRYLNALVKSRKHKTADAAANVCRMTAYRWRSTEPFASAYNDARSTVACWAEDMAMEIAAREDQAQSAAVLLRVLQAFSPARWSPRMDHSHQGTVDFQHVKRVSREGVEEPEE
jgi:hypothetical protein